MFGKRKLFILTVLFVVPLAFAARDFHTPTGSEMELSSDSIEKSEDSDDTLLSWNPSGWQLAILREAEYALSRRTNGTSAVILRYGGGSYYGSDWDYVNSDRGARNLMRNHYGGSTGSYGYWYESIARRSCGHGGWCKFFADLVQWRATGGALGFLPRNNQARGSIDYVEPSDIIQKTNGTDHTAIVYRILERYPDGRVKKVDVIDCNFIGGNGEYIIARHPISRPELSQYHTYH
jgi:hypothetical protein